MSVTTTIQLNTASDHPTFDELRAYVKLLEDNGADFDTVVEVDNDGLRAEL